jgi:uncharacterized protein
MFHFCQRAVRPTILPVLLLLASGCERFVAETYKGGDHLIRSAVYPDQRPVHELAQAGDVDGLRKYLEQYPFRINSRARARADRTPLHFAVESEQVEVVALLLSMKADYDVRDALQRTPLYLALRDSHFRIAGLLLDDGANPNLPDRLGIDPLHLAAQRGDGQMVTLLLRYGARVEASSPKESVTPLMLALVAGHEDAAMALLSHGADPNSKTRDGATPSDLARRAGNRKVIEALEKRGARPGTDRYLGDEFKDR